jgi:soluble lytic murein transglycosylase-like protein
LRAALALAIALAIPFAAPATAQAAEPPVQPPAPADLATLLALARNPAPPAAGALARFQISEPKALPPEAGAIWPLYTFLLAEAHRRQGDAQRSLALHRTLIEWAASNPYGDGSGGSALATVSLWRVLSEPAPAAEDRARFDLAYAYWSNRGALADGLFEAPPVIGALPKLRESILRGMIALAWSLGERRKAYTLAAEYVDAATDAIRDEPERSVLDEAFAAGVLPRAKTWLAFGKRLDRLGKADAARELFRAALESKDPDVAGDARLQLARELRDSRGRPCVTPELRAQVDAVLATAASPDLVQCALIFRARRHLGRGCPIDLGGYESDLGRLMDAFPRARATFDALFTLADFHLDRYLDGADDAALDRALDRFAMARRMVAGGDATGPEEELLRSPSVRAQEQLGQAWFKPAIGLYLRGRAADRRQAAALLEELNALWPNGPLRDPARFWRGRLYAESGNAGAAAGQFQAILAQSPYDYYGIRARLRLQLGERARTTVALDDATAAALREAYARSRARASPAPAATPFGLRVNAAIAAGVYEAALGSRYVLRRDRFPGRMLEDLNPQELDTAGALVGVAVALALRGDALAAAERPATAENLAQVARRVSSWPAQGWIQGDWPLAVVIAGARFAPEAARARVQLEPDYLAAAYPPAYAEAIRSHAARASLPPSLLYAVIRTETVFDPAAESARGALGLFQFIPSTFRTLNARWKLVDARDPRAVEAFLLTPDSNIALGARWFREDLLPREDGDVLYALMAHNAGPAAVARWKEAWQRYGRLGDYELAVETARYEETRGFARRALAAMWIANASN